MSLLFLIETRSCRKWVQNPCSFSIPLPRGKPRRAQIFRCPGRSPFPSVLRRIRLPCLLFPVQCSISARGYRRTIAGQLCRAGWAGCNFSFAPIKKPAFRPAVFFKDLYYLPPSFPPSPSFGFSSGLAFSVSMGFSKYISVLRLPESELPAFWNSEYQSSLILSSGISYLDAR